MVDTLFANTIGAGSVPLTPVTMEEELERGGKGKRHGNNFEGEETIHQSLSDFKKPDFTLGTDYIIYIYNVATSKHC